MELIARLEAPDFIVIALIIAVLSAPCIVAAAIVLFLSWRRNKPPPLPPSINPAGENK